MLNENEDQILKGSTANKKENESWLEHSYKTKQEEPTRLEDAAKFLAGMISISLTIFLKINDDGFRELEQYNMTKVIVISWLLSLISSFLVLYPFTYSYATNSVASIKKMHKKVVRRKQILLFTSVMAYMFALILLGTYFLQSIGK